MRSWWGRGLRLGTEFRGGGRRRGQSQFGDDLACVIERRLEALGRYRAHILDHFHTQASLLLASNMLSMNTRVAAVRMQAGSHRGK